jgi:hypothetical protein
MRRRMVDCTAVTRAASIAVASKTVIGESSSAPRNDTGDDADVKRGVLVAGGAAVVDAGDSSNVGGWAGAGALLLEGLCDHAQNAAQCGAADRWSALQEGA